MISTFARHYHIARTVLDQAASCGHGALGSWLPVWLIGCRCEGSTVHFFLNPISDSKFHIQQISLPASVAEKYSALVEDKAMIPWSLDNQLMALVPTFTMYLPLDHPLSLHPP